MDNEAAYNGSRSSPPKRIQKSPTVRNGISSMQRRMPLKLPISDADVRNLKNA